MGLMPSSRKTCGCPGNTYCMHGGPDKNHGHIPFRSSILPKTYESIDESWQPRVISSFTTEEKLIAFERLHQDAINHYNEAMADPNVADNPGDLNYYYEQIMELLGEGVWEALAARAQDATCPEELYTVEW